MNSAIRIFIFFILNYLVTHQMIPAEMAESFKNDPQALLLIEAGIALVGAALIETFRAVLKDVPTYIRAFVAAWVTLISDGRVKLPEEPAPKPQDSNESSGEKK